ncbi:LOW QUALITY PROTEIN: protein PROCA1 [Nannospalax galili]|uniref:LOW QUALITY PROTEIN: protein PROCA1 n=1 Tax=Nannospalax galili TaxID=1026970 RepID=UPI0004ED3E56|nr:LOW QUALITY PROTEIN: protein PROCA1 [Nannospalax galili]
MWVRTTLTIKRWTEEKTGYKAELWDESENTGECKETDRCCWKHKQCAGHIIHPFLDYGHGHHNLHLHAVCHCNCESRLKDFSERINSSSSGDLGSTCSTDGSSTCFNIVHIPCFELIPEEQCVEQFWYSWCKSYRPDSVAMIHHPIHHECGSDHLNEEEETQSPTLTQVCPTAMPTSLDTGSGTGAPDSAAPITIWFSESPTDKSQGSKLARKQKKKKKEKEKDEDEMTDEKANLKTKPKSKLPKKKSPGKSESSPPDLSQSLSPREPVRTSESSPESREELESENSYSAKGQERPSSEDAVESSLPRKRQNTAQAKKNGTKTLQTRKTTKRKSPPVSNPNLS